MKKNLFKIMITALSIVLIIAAMPFAASAETSALGTESPYISAQFFDSNEEEVDGNALTAGERYTVNFVLSDISSVAIFNMTANFTNDISIVDVTSIAEVENSGFEYGGYKGDTDNNSFVIVISTVNNTTYTELDGDTVMVTLTVDVNTDGDFADFFDLSTSRNHTFIIANLEEGNEAAYVYKDLEQTATDYPFLDFDMSPSSNIVVSGEVRISTSLDCTQYSSKGIEGVIVAAGDFGSAGYKSASDLPDATAYTTTDSNGAFTLEVPSGTTAITVLGESTINRVVTLDASSTGSVGNIIPVVICDYNHDGSVDVTDMGAFLTSYYKTDNYSAFADFNVDDSVDVTDMGAFLVFYYKTDSFAYTTFNLN